MVVDTGARSSRGESHVNPPLRSVTIDGGGAGDHTVTGIQVGDVLKSVQRVDAANANLVDEFEITADDTINNTGGTDTTGWLLLVLYYEASTFGGPDYGRA